MSAKSRKHTGREKNFVRRFFSTLGPGLIAGAADDDPSGIATYTIAGAQLGTSLLTWPLMGCVQFICARIGMVTGMGLGAALKKKIPRWLLVLAAFALFGANSINIGADLFGMADAGEMLSRLNSHLLIVIVSSKSFELRSLGAHTSNAQTIANVSL
jgi:Mn2+/Fe2+ NRAMP family transporter